MWCETQQTIAGFEDEIPQAKECRQHLEAGKGKETNYLLEPPEGMQSCQHFDFNLLRPVLDFWPSEL